jgi:hypothetical protein
MEVRVSQYKISAGLADLGAVEQQGDVIGLCMFAAFLQAVRKRRQAHVVTRGHDFDTGVFLMGHCLTPLGVLLRNKGAVISVELPT